MSAFLGIDTSNYTTSAALVSDGRVEKNYRQVLAVKQGERGLRQSDAVFAHTVNLPIIVGQIGACRPDAIGVSLSPRDAQDSYMPCFLAGKACASAIASVIGVPLYGFSHQRGHIAAALYSCGKSDLYDGEFLAFHVSGGTTEIVRVCSGEIALIGGTEDLSCGKVIDRVGVMLGLSFPCGKELEILAREGRVTERVRPCVRDLRCNLSGVENLAGRMLDAGESKENIAAFVMEYIGKTLEMMTAQARDRYPGLAVVYAGGVMSNQAIRPALAAMGESYFASPEFSCDNAAGIALLCEREWLKQHG